MVSAWHARDQRLRGEREREEKGERVSVRQRVTFRKGGRERK